MCAEYDSPFRRALDKQKVYYNIDLPSKTILSALHQSTKSLHYTEQPLNMKTLLYYVQVVALHLSSFYFYKTPQLFDFGQRSLRYSAR